MNLVKLTAIASIVASSAAHAPAAHAYDACAVVLCISFSGWNGISECVPPVREMMRDLARGKRMKKCSLASASDSSAPADEPQVDDVDADLQNCPTGHVQFTRGKPRCDFDRAIRLTVDGQVIRNVWFDAQGNVATQECLADASTQPDVSPLDSLLTETPSSDSAVIEDSSKPECTEPDCANFTVNRPPIAADHTCRTSELVTSD